LIEEEHVTHYESLVDPGETWWEQLVNHEYNECYLYYSFMETEPDPKVKAIWELHLNMELEHLRARTTNGSVSAWPIPTRRAPSATRRSISASPSPSVRRSG
jgi:hypothetical protein